MENVAMRGKRLLRALNAVIFDCDIESKPGAKPVQVHFDADIVIGAFEDYAQIQRDLGSANVGAMCVDPKATRLAMRALWACGFACKARLLSTHAAEVIERINREVETNGGRPQSSSRDTKAEKRARFRKTVGQYFEVVKDQLVAIQQSGTIVDGGRIAETFPVWLLAGLIAVLPDWEARLELITGESLDIPDVEELKQSAERFGLLSESAEPIAHAIQVMRSSLAEKFAAKVGLSRLRIATNTWRDAIALNELHLTYQTNRAVRFVTSTDVVSTVCGNLWTSKWDPLLLTNQNTTQEDVAEHPLRSSLYVLIRSIIRGFAFKDARYSIGLDGVLNADDVRQIVSGANNKIATLESDHRSADVEQVYRDLEVALVQSMNACASQAVWFENPASSVSFVLKHAKVDSAVAANQQAQEVRSAVSEAVRQWTTDQLVTVAKSVGADGVGKFVTPAAVPDDILSSTALRELLDRGASRWLAMLAPSAESIDEMAEFIHASADRFRSPVDGNLSIDSAVLWAHLYATVMGVTDGKFHTTHDNLPSTRFHDSSFKAGAYILTVLDIVAASYDRRLQRELYATLERWKALSAEGIGREIRELTAPHGEREQFYAWTLRLWGCVHYCDGEVLRRVTKKPRSYEDAVRPVKDFALRAITEFEQQTATLATTAFMRTASHVTAAKVLLWLYAGRIVAVEPSAVQIMASEAQVGTSRIDLDMSEAHQADAWCWSHTITHSSISTNFEAFDMIRGHWYGPSGSDNSRNLGPPPESYIVNHGGQVLRAKQS